MIKTYIGVPGVDESVLHPVITSVSKTIRSLAQIDPDTHIEVGVENMEYVNNNWTLNSERSDRLGPQANYINVKYSEEFNHRSVISGQIRRVSNLSVLEDESVGLRIKPVLTDAHIELEFIFKSKSKTTIGQTLNRLKRLTAAGRLNYAVSISYMYYLSGPIMGLLNEILIIKNEVEEKSTTLRDYIDAISDSRITTVTDITIDMSKTNVSFREEQSRIQLLVDPGVISSKITFEPSTGYFSIGLTANFTFNKPDTFEIVYEPMFYNKILPPDYLTLVDIHKDVCCELDRYGNYIIPYQASGPLQIPQFVNIPNELDTKPGMCPVFSVLIQIDDTQCLFNLRDIPGYVINPIIIDFLESGEWNYISRPYRSVFHIELFENDNLIHYNKVIINENLDICTILPLDRLKTYRVVLSAVVDTVLIQEEDYDRAKDTPELTNEIINVIVDGPNTYLKDPTRFSPRLEMIGWIIAHWLTKTR